MEAKLKEYRELRRRRELVKVKNTGIEKAKERVKGIFKFILPDISSNNNMSKEKQEDEVYLIQEEEESEQNTIVLQTCEESLDEESEESWKYCSIKWIIFSVIWLTLFLFFLKLQFGAVFFVISALIGIYLNTRTRPRRKGEVSAYSVFNENCKSIGGTLKAEQLEREICYGPGIISFGLNNLNARVSVEGEPRSGQPVSVVTEDTVGLVKKIILADRRVKQCEIARDVGISKERVHVYTILKPLV